MRKTLLLMVVVFFPMQAYSQLVLMDPLVSAVMQATHIEQVIYYAQQLEDNIMQIENFRRMIENTGQQIDMAVQNLKSLDKIESWDDFVEFYNRQLYLERQAMQSFDNMHVTIGKKDYKLTDVYGMAEGFMETHVDYWNKEFTEEQRKEMWLGLGLTPANYAYVQPFRAKANELTKQGLTAVGIQNDWYTRNMEKNYERQKIMAEDKYKDVNDQLGEKGMLMMILDSLIETNKVMNDVAMNQAIEREERAVDKALDKAPKYKPPLADWSERTGFEKIP